MVAFAYYLSYRLRFNSPEFSVYFKVFLSSLPAVIACKLSAFLVIGIYRAMWGYMSTSDVFVYIKASTVATLFSVVAVTFIYRFQDFSKGIFIIDWLLTTGYLLGSRGSFKLFIDTMKKRTLDGDRVIIYGAGRGGEILLREILNNKDLGIRPIGFIDDDNRKVGKKIQGYPVLGNLKNAKTICSDHRIGGIIVAFRNNSTAKTEQLDALCREHEVFLKRFSITLEDI
jgi:UDP-GlcNAc:undecaprenyl-phosphate GlcNAc-1-phosphate transferase